MTKELKRKVRHINFKVLEMSINSLLEKLRYETFDNFYRGELKKAYDEIVHNISKNEDYKDFIPSLDTAYRCSTDSWDMITITSYVVLTESDESYNSRIKHIEDQKKIGQKMSREELKKRKEELKLYKELKKRYGDIN